MKVISFLIFCISSSLAWSTIAAEPRWQVEDIDSSEAAAAAEAAADIFEPVVLVAGFEGGDIYVEGSDKGGIDIIGLGSDTTGVPLDLQGAISDLDADITDYGYKISLSGDVLFEFDQDALKPEAKETLEKVVLLATKENASEIRIEGHTDAKGEDGYNLDLSRRRAESVKSWLTSQGGIEPGIILATGLGETKPVAENETAEGSDNPEGRALNRRVDIYVKKPE